MRFGSKVGTGPEGPRLENVQVTFTKPLILKNPSALADIPLGDLGDALVDVHITGAKVDAEGRLIPEGRVKGFLIDRPLSDFVKPEDMPKLDLDLKDILAGNLFPPDGTPPRQGEGRRDIKAGDLLRQLGPMIGKGEYSTRLEGEHSTITVGDKLLTIEGKGPKDAKVQIAGSLDLDNAGRFQFTGAGQVHTQVADFNAQAQGQFGIDAQEKPDLAVAVQSKVDLKDADVVHLPSGQKAAIDGSHSTEELQATANVRMQGGKLAVDAGKAQMDVRASADLQNVGAGGASFTGQLGADLKASSDFSVGPDGVKASPQVRIEPVSGQGQVSAGGIDIPVSVVGQGSAIAGSMAVQVQGNQVTVSDGTADLRLTLDAKAPAIQVLGGELTFDGRTLLTGKTKLGFDPDQGFSLDDGQVRAEATLKEGKLEAKGLRLELAEGSSLNAEVKNIHVGPDGVRFSDPTAGFDLLLPGSDFQLGGLKLGLDEKLPSRLSGSTTLKIENQRPVLPKEGEASVQFQLYGKELGGPLFPVTRP